MRRVSAAPNEVAVMEDVLRTCDDKQDRPRRASRLGSWRGLLVGFAIGFAAMIVALLLIALLR